MSVDHRGAIRSRELQQKNIAQEAEGCGHRCLIQLASDPNKTPAKSAGVFR
jgi:hypothetical protein